MSMQKPGGSTMPGPEQIPLGSTSVVEEQQESAARKTLANIAARQGYGADDLRLVLRMLNLIDSGPSGGRYNPNGRRVRPGSMPKNPGGDR